VLRLLRLLERMLELARNRRRRRRLGLSSLGKVNTMFAGPSYPQPHTQDVWTARASSSAPNARPLNPPSPLKDKQEVLDYLRKKKLLFRFTWIDTYIQ